MNPPDSNESGAKLPPLRIRRINLDPCPIHHPSDQQIALWSLREGILQRLAPSEALRPPDRISFTTMQRLRALYRASVERWYRRKCAEDRARRATGLTIAQAVSNYFANPQ